MPFTKQHSACAWVVTCILFLINLTFHNLSLHSSYTIHQPFTDYFLRLPYSEQLEKRLFRSRANRRLVFGLREFTNFGDSGFDHLQFWSTDRILCWWDIGHLCKKKLLFGHGLSSWPVHVQENCTNRGWFVGWPAHETWRAWVATAWLPLGLMNVNLPWLILINNFNKGRPNVDLPFFPFGMYAGNGIGSVLSNSQKVHPGNFANRMSCQKMAQTCQFFPHHRLRPWNHNF